MEHQLADRIVQALREGNEPLEAEAIARTYLKLTNAHGTAARALVRTVLGRDSRFSEQADGRWGLVTEKPELQPPVLLCVPEIPRGTERTPWLWRLWGRLWPEAGAPIHHDGAHWSESLEALLTLMESHPVATLNPGAVNRWLGAQERLHVLAERTPLTIDLRSWQSLLAPAPETAGESVHARAPRPAARPQTVEERLAQMRDLMDRVLSAAQERRMGTWAQVARVAAENGERLRDGVWRSDWALTREEVGAVPEEPGIYRFWAADDQLLYVGKAKNLRQRIATYFRPLDSDQSRRAEFLKQVHRLDFETTGTELEALICEAGQIREHVPRWNVQVTVTDDAGGGSAGDTDLLLLLPHVVEGAYSLFALQGERAARATLAPEVDLAGLRDCLRDFYVEQSVAGLLREIAAPERTFVRRWMRRTHPGSAVLRLVDFATFAALVSAVENVISRSPDLQPQMLREPPGPISEAP